MRCRDEDGAVERVGDVWGQQARGDKAGTFVRGLGRNAEGAREEGCSGVGAQQHSRGPVHGNDTRELRGRSVWRHASPAALARARAHPLEQEADHEHEEGRVGDDDKGTHRLRARSVER